ncbi:hypothetical protein N8I74_03350 [Chitiniphilus purpureus]|uniref:Uncharacterized protein n=1 Tax=Chitiniphilus purpureus TaxID=2981137 RepID=A0ABY6DQT0_9NEIS|nr:hypothetical protein [Chitiniphilus sp. CD1]UXY16073.1 hypothetical protein N8I74_03350 [Chitiniphilus sp. CD1]
MLTLFKILLSIPVAVALAYPFLNPGAGGLLGEIRLLGPAGSVVAIAAFLWLVYRYACDLRQTLLRVAPAARPASPDSVWLIFLLPYNFIEDFFIIANVAKALRNEAQHNPALAGFRSFGMASGIGWCAAQIVSLLPNLLGSVAGLLAIVLWLGHWRFIRRANRALAPAAVPQPAV